jgi:hypothetical protein
MWLGLTGIGLLCAAVLGGGLAWAGPLAYMVVAACKLYAATAWRGLDRAPWIGRSGRRTMPRRAPRRPGVRRREMVVSTVHGARDSVCWPRRCHRAGGLPA